MRTGHTAYRGRRRRVSPEVVPALRQDPRDNRRMRPTFALTAVLLALLTVAPLAGQAPPAGRAEAYQAFLEGRRFESVGDVAKAIEAYERAAKLEPANGMALAELAQLYARRERVDDARAAAQRALQVNPDQPDAHWVLGMLAMARAGGQRETSAPDRALLQEAIDHFSRSLPARAYDLNVYINLGRLYLQTDQPAKAVEPLTTVYNRDAGALEAGLLLAQAHEQAGNRPRALEVVSTVLDTEPRFFRARLLQADLLERERRWAEAAAAYAQAFADNPKATELQVRAATALLNADRPAEARDVLDAAVKARPSDLQARYLLAQAQRSLGDLAAAEQTGTALRALAPSDSRGPVVLSQVYADRREHQKVIDVLAPLLASRGTSLARGAVTGLTLRLAAAHLALGQADEAIAVLEQASASQDDGLVDAYLLQALVNTRRYDRAIVVGERVRDARPDDPQPERLLALAYAGVGRVDDAVALMRAQVEARAGDLRAVTTLADVLSTSGRHDAAVEALASREDAFAKQVDYWFQRGAVEERAGDVAAAEEAFRKALALDDAHAPSLNYLGYMLAEQGVQLDEAVRLVKQALAVDPDNGSYLDSLGWALYKQGHYEEARRFLERAAGLLADNSVIQDHLGDARLAMKDTAGAIEAWERALAGDGASIDADAIRRKIARTRDR